MQSAPTPAPPSSTPTASPQPQHTNQPLPHPCRDFNNGVCRRHTCRFRHVCARCHDQGTGRGSAPLPIDHQQLVTPLRSLVLERELANHPNKDFVSQLLHNIQHGCSIGYEGPQFPHIARHLPSAHAHPNIISEALAKECLAGRMAGPYDTPPLPNIHCSGLGVVPKKDSGWRTIYDLSSPTGCSVNDFIDPTRFFLHYCTIDAATAILNTLGPGTLMGKMDLKNSFRLLPVRRLDWHLLGIFWQNHWYLDKFLPFGLRSSPFLFNQLAEALEWILVNNYRVANIIHYLDDFFTAGPPDSPECLHNMTAMALLCEHVNAPLKSEKAEGPTTTLTFLGIELNSVDMTASISAERKVELLHSLHSILASRTCTKRTLLSLTGKLSFACKVVPPSRIFLRRLIDLSTSVSRLHHHVTLTSTAKADPIGGFVSSRHGLAPAFSCRQSGHQPLSTATVHRCIRPRLWWVLDRSLVQSALASPPTASLYRLAGNVRSVGSLLHMGYVLATETDPLSLQQPSRRCSVGEGYKQMPATHNFHLCIVHIPGTNNCIADHLSRLSLQAFLLAAPAADLSPTPAITPALPTAPSRHSSPNCRP